MTEPTFRPYPATATDERPLRAPEPGSPAHLAQLASTQGAAGAGVDREAGRRRPRTLLAIGGVLAALLVASGAWTGLGTIGAVNRTESAPSPGLPRHLAIIADVAAVDVVTGAVDRPTFRYHAPWPATDGFRLTENGDDLTVEVDSRPSSPISLPGFLAYPALTVTLPQGTPIESLDVELQTGSLDLRAPSRSARLKTGTGSIDVQADATNLDAYTATGSIYLAGKVSGQVSLGTGTGSIDTVFQAAPATTRLVTQTGSIDATFADATYSVSTRVGVGSVTDNLRHDPASGHQVVAETGTGSINLVRR